MAKNKNAKTAKKEEVKNTATPVAEKTETKKESVETQVAAPTVTEAPKAETKKEEKKAPEAKKETPKAKKEKTPTVIPEEVHEPLKPKGLDIPAGVAIGAQSSSFDGKAQLAFVMNNRYNNPEVQKNYPEFFKAMSQNIDVVVTLALLDLRNELASRAENGELKLTVTPDQILQLNEAAGMLGIELAPAKALPGAKDGQMTIDFKDSKIPEELQESKPAETEEIELDPNKVTTVDGLKATLNHLLKNGKNIPENIVNTVEWYRVYCINNEENADKKLALDDRSVKEWLEEIFNIIEPTAIFNGFGGAMYLYASQSGSPVQSHCILHKYVSKAGWSEEQIADLVKTFIEGKYRLKVQKDGMEDKPETNKALNAIIGKLGLPYIDKIFADANSEGDENAETRAAARKVLGLIRTNYFDKEQTPTPDELRMKLGQIINLYRDPMERLDTFMQAEGEYPEPTKKEEVGEKKN